MTHGSSTYDAPAADSSSQEITAFDIQMSVARDSAMAILGCLLRNPHLAGLMPEYGFDLVTIDPELHAISQAIADAFEEGEQHDVQTQMDMIPFVTKRWKHERFGRDFRQAQTLLFRMWETACSPQAIKSHAQRINEFNGIVVARQAFNHLDRFRESNPDSGQMAAKLQVMADQLKASGTVIDYLPPKFTMRPRTIADIRKTLKPPVFLIDYFLAEGKLGVMGGQEKSWKTSLAMDMAVSMDQGVPFLGKFNVPRRRKVVFITIETGEDDLVELHDAVCKVKGIDPDDTGVLIQTVAPCFDKPADLAELSKWLKNQEVEVCFLDPLYLMAISAGSETKPSDMYAMGRLLTGASQACLRVGCTPIFIHHSSQTANALRKFNKPKLGDLSYAGIREIARQWILVGHCREYDSNRGVGTVWVCYGGARHRGDFALQIDEGPTGAGCVKQWETTIIPSSEVEGQSSPSGRSNNDREDKKHDGAALAAADRIDPDRKGFTENRLYEDLRANEAKMGRGTVKDTVARLCEGGYLEPCKVLVTFGKGGERDGAGFRRSNRHLSDDLPSGDGFPSEGK